jgi:hypothetical protein
MPERADSIDSFDEFFGESKTDDDRKKSPIKPKEKEPTIAAIVKNQPVVKRPQTPSTPEERILSSSNSKRKNLLKKKTIFVFLFFNKRK